MNAKAPHATPASYIASPVIKHENHDWLIANHKRHLAKLEAEGKTYQRRVRF